MQSPTALEREAAGIPSGDSWAVSYDRNANSSEPTPIFHQGLPPIFMTRWAMVAARVSVVRFFQARPQRSGTHQ
jgi:hypothetical protein